MTKTPFVSFKDIKKAVSMVQVLEHYGLMQTLSPRGEDAFTGPCPVHQGTNPTQFRVSLSKNCWNCFGQCPGGNVLDFVAQMEKTDIRQAALLLVQWFGLEGKGGATPKETPPAPEPVQEIHEMALPSALSPEIPSEPAANAPLPFPGLKHLDPEHDYLMKRGFGRATMEHFGVGFCQKGMMKGRIAIPIHDAKGELLAYAGRATSEGGHAEDLYKYPPNFRKDLEVYNLNRAVWSSRVGTEGMVLVSDFFDVFSPLPGGLRQRRGSDGDGLERAAAPAAPHGPGGECQNHAPAAPEHTRDRGDHLQAYRHLFRAPGAHRGESRRHAVRASSGASIRSRRISPMTP
jgi:DNA primase